MYRIWFIIILLTGTLPSFGTTQANEEAALYVLVQGADEQSAVAINLSDGTLYSLLLPENRLDLDWNAVTDSLYVMAESQANDGIAVYKFAASGRDPSLIVEIPEIQSDEMVIHHEATSIIFAIQTPGINFPNEGVGFLVYDMTEQRLSPTSTELSIDGKTDQLLFLVDMRWSPDGELIALETIRQPEENKVSLIDIQCLLQHTEVCEAQTLYGDSHSHGSHKPHWSPDSMQLAFLCFEAGFQGELCLWNRTNKTLELVSLAFTERQDDLAWLPESRQLMIVEHHGYLRDEVVFKIFDLDSHTVISEFVYPENLVYSYTRIGPIVPETFVMNWGTLLTDKP